MRLTICFCFFRVSSPVSGLPSLCSTSRISLIISPTGPLALVRRRHFFFRLRPVSSSSRSSISLSLPPSLAAIGLLGSRRLLALWSSPPPATPRGRSSGAGVVLGLAQLLEQVVELLILAGDRRCAVGFAAGLSALRRPVACFLAAGLALSLGRRPWPSPPGPDFRLPWPIAVGFAASPACRISTTGRSPDRPELLEQGVERLVLGFAGLLGPGAEPGHAPGRATSEQDARCGFERHRSFLPVVPFRSGHVTNQVGQDPLLFAQPLELGGLLGGQRSCCVGAVRRALRSVR